MRFLRQFLMIHEFREHALRRRRRRARGSSASGSGRSRPCSSEEGRADLVVSGSRSKWDASSSHARAVS